MHSSLHSASRLVLSGRYRLGNLAVATATAVVLAAGTMAPAAAHATTSNAYRAEASRPSSLTMKQAQTILRSRGLYRGDIDGIAGPKTEVALKTFQHEAGLTPSGTLNTRTIAALLGYGSAGSGPGAAHVANANAQGADNGPSQGGNGFWLAANEGPSGNSLSALPPTHGAGAAGTNANGTGTTTAANGVTAGGGGTHTGARIITVQTEHPATTTTAPATTTPPAMTTEGTKPVPGTATVVPPATTAPATTTALNEGWRSGGWGGGWWGLIGLIGLFGLAGRGRRGPP